MAFDKHFKNSDAGEDALVQSVNSPEIFWLPNCPSVSSDMWILQQHQSMSLSGRDVATTNLDCDPRLHGDASVKWPYASISAF